MPTFTVIRDGSVIEDSVFDVDPVVDTSNPFGDFSVVKMDDRGGEKFDAYNRGTRVEITVDPEDNTLTIDSGETVTTDSGDTDEYNTVNNAGTYSNQGTVTAGTGTSQQFTGYCVEPRETEQSGADVLEVESYSFDQFLRRNTVTNDQTGNLISEALQDIIETDTPVSYNAAKIDVGDDQELTRSYRGEPVEAVFRDLAFKSNNEEFGVDGDLDAFFRPRETEHIDRGIDDTQWFNYDIPELGKEAVNEVEVWFDDGDESVIVDDGTDKLDLQESLDLPEPGTQRAELNRPLITDITDAEDIGRKYLAFRNATLSGTVTTYGLFNADPGDTIDVTIEPRGIDTEFVIAATEYRWGRDETTLTIVENRGEVDDILSELNDSVQRQEMEGADRDAPKNRITTTNATALIDVSFTAAIQNTDVETVNSGETLTVASGTTETATTVANAGTVANSGTFETRSEGMQDAPADRLVNPGRRAVRDAWAGDAPPDITTVAIGTDGDGLSRSNTALRNRVDSATVTQTLPDATSVRFASSVAGTGVEELGLEAADGTLIARATFDDPVEMAGVEVTLSVRNDDSVTRGVLTTVGQTAIRDVLADTNPTIPTDYAYGSDDTPVSESDTALGNELITTSLDNILIQNASTASGWANITPDFADDVPLTTENGSLETLQSCWAFEAEDAALPGFLDPDYSGGDSLRIGADTTREFTFTSDHDIPSGEAKIDIRAELDADVEIVDHEFSINGTTLGAYGPVVINPTLGWIELFTTTETISAGENTLTIETVNETINTDFTADYTTTSVTDETFRSNFDNAVSLSNANLVDGSETVTETDGTGTFTEGDDYDMDYANGTITVLSSGDMVDNADYLIDYDYRSEGAWSDLPATQITSESETVSIAGSPASRGDDYEMDYANGRVRPVVGGQLDDGDTYDIDFEGYADGRMNIDLVAVYDTGDRFDTPFSYFFDNDNGGSSGYLDGPQSHPQLVETSFTTATTRRDVTEANFDLTAPDVTGNFYVELANDGSTFTRFDNQTSGSVTFAAADPNVDTNVGLGRYGSRTGTTPETGYLGQQIDTWELFANPDAVTSDDIGTTITRAVVPPNTAGVVGETIREAGLKNGSALLTRHVLAEFELLADQRLASSESTTVSGGD